MLALIFNKWNKRQDEKKNTVQLTMEEQIEQAKANQVFRSDLIKSYQPYVAKIASKVCKQYIDQSRDEYSVAMEAFNEAIDHYQQNQGSSFLSFAEMVIRRRVIDYIRKESRQTRDIYLENETQDEEQSYESMAQINASVAQYEALKQSERRRYDILEYQEILSEYDISFQDLVEACPKHIDARDNAKHIAKLLASREEYIEHLKEKKQLPMKDLLKNVKCSRKTVERNRKYIIAMAIIYIYGFNSLKSYIEPESPLEENRREGNM